MKRKSGHRRLILVTNDDGVHAPGLQILAGRLKELGEVYVVAPEREQSAVGHSLTLRHPLRINKLGARVVSVEGTPTDCVLLAYYNILLRKPDIVFSGINFGHNLGDDITYSGTVSAAFEAVLLGIPAIAVSIGRDGRKVHYDAAAGFAVKLGRKALDEGLPKDTLLNVNLPNLPASRIKGVVMTKQGRRSYDDVIVAKVDPRGRPYFWIGNGRPRWEEGNGTDIQAVRAGKISITPVHLDLTNHGAIDSLRSWKMKP